MHRPPKAVPNSVGIDLKAHLGPDATFHSGSGGKIRSGCHLSVSGFRKLNERRESTMSQDGEGSLAQRLEELRASQPEKSALLQPYYRDPEIFDRDMERIHLSRWVGT